MAPKEQAKTAPSRKNGLIVAGGFCIVGGKGRQFVMAIAGEGKLKLHDFR